MRSLIIFLFLIFNCNTVLALNSYDADKFGDNFIASMQAGESINFIPNKLHLETFLDNAFDRDYLELTPNEINQTKTSLANSMQILHSSPTLKKPRHFTAGSLTSIS